MKKFLYDDLWLGDSKSLSLAVDAATYSLDHQDREGPVMEQHIKKVMGSPMFQDHGMGEDDYEPFFDLISQVNDIGIIDISGSLVAESSWINSIFGITSYEDIVNALGFFLNDADISRIVLNIDSGGGEAGGVDSAAEAISLANRQKPVYAMVNGGAMSAAYWLASSARNITSSPMSETGSIGVMMIHTSRQRRLEQEGIDVTLIKAGSEKGIGHPSQQLSERDIAVLQEKADTLYGFFLDHVATQRAGLNLSSKSVWAEGKTFFAAEALQVGLIDRVDTINGFFKSLKVDNPQGGTNNTQQPTFKQENTPMKAVHLKSDADKAALESGADLATLQHDEVDDDTAAEEETAAATAEDAGEDIAAAAASVEGEEGTAPAAAAVSGTGFDVTMLDRLTTLATDNAKLASNVETLNTQLQALRTNLDGLKGIAISAIHRMQIALKMDPSDLSGLPEETILAQYSATKEKFEKSFRVGQSSASAADQSSGEARVPVGIVRKIS